MILSDTYSEMENTLLELGLEISHLKYHISYYSYKGIEVGRLVPNGLSTYHDRIRISTEITYEGDKIKQEAGIFWGGTTFINLDDPKAIPRFIDKIKELCANIDKAKMAVKLMENASKVAVIQGE